MERKLMIAILVVISVASTLYGLLYPYISNEIKAQKRQAALVSGRGERKSGRGVDQAKRRKVIAETLKEVEQTSKNKSLGLEQRIAQAGLSWSVREFYIGSAACGSVLGFIVYFLGGDMLIAIGALVAGAWVLPRWLISFLGKRRILKFAEHFPDALDVIIRGIKAGLPVSDCLRLIASEGQEPVRSEFKRVVEAQAVGMTVAESVDRLAERVVTPEASFFAIVLNIQQKTGGNLSEALGNLSRVLRDRKKMKAKVRAMSAEAKASAGIIGSLPFLVGGAVSFLNPSYMATLYTTDLGKMCLVGSGVWMLLGVLIMRKMIDFDF